MSKAGYPGVSVAITKDNQNVHVQGYGDDANGAPIGPTTRMPVASVSKTITAAAVLQLVDAGKLDLDAPVYDYLDDFRIEDARGARITVRQLLNQTSGITDMTLREKSLPQPATLAEAAKRASDADLAADPGEKYAYSNTNFHLAARVVEMAAQKPFGDYLEREIFTPAGMTSTTTIDVTPDDLPSDVADGHLYAYGMTPPATEPHRFVGGSDGVVTTAADMAKWLVIQQNRGRTANGAEVIPAAAIPESPTSERAADYALGWEQNRGDGRSGHSGVWFTYTADILLTDSGYGIAVLGNGGFGLGNEGTVELTEQIAELTEGKQTDGATSMRLETDLALAALTLLTVGLAVRRLTRTSQWVNANRSGGWRALTLRLAPRLLPVVLLLLLPYLLGRFVSGGRDITLLQLAHYSPALVTWAGVAALLNLVTIGVRVAGLARSRKASSIA